MTTDSQRNLKGWIHEIVLVMLSLRTNSLTEVGEVPAGAAYCTYARFEGFRFRGCLTCHCQTYDVWYRSCTLCYSPAAVTEGCKFDGSQAA
jgi:hypothetical protein